MRSPRFFSVACRAPNGQILVQTEAIEQTWIGKQKWLKYPFLRGSLALLDSMALGSRALRFASNIQLDPAYEKPDDSAPVADVALPDADRVRRVRSVLTVVQSILFLALLYALFVAIRTKPAQPLAGASATIFRHWQWSLYFLSASLAATLLVVEILFTSKVRREQALLDASAARAQRASAGRKGAVVASTVAGPSQAIQSGAIGLTLFVSFLIGLGIFVYLPNLIAEASQRAGGHTNGTRINIVSEVVKVVIFFGYIGLLGTLKDIREIFKYHGAEHKAINTLEADQPLEMSYCLKQTRLHPRCGTSFAIIVLILGLITFTFVPRYPISHGRQGNMFADIAVRVLLELLILPIIAGVAYELLRIAGKFRNQSLLMVLFKPGIWSQYLTTREPDEPQIEVALEALRAVIKAEQAGKVAGKQPMVLQGASEP